MNRRTFLSALSASAVVLGFHPGKRRWVTAASADAPASFDRLPPLDGVLVTDPASLAADVTDAGNIIFETPGAILKPGSVEDIRAMIKYCRRRGIVVAARGQHHTTFGQGLVAGGLTIEMSSLDAIHSFDAGGADVDAGVKWKDLLQVTVPNGLAPPVLTAFTGLSIGGTLSVGGISPTWSQGPQVDHVQELEVVTGEGELVRCSPSHHSELFEGVLAGLGQLGIITRARVDLVPVKAMTRTYLLYYVDNATFFADLRTLLNRGEFNDLWNLWSISDGAPVYQLNATVQFDPANPPDDAHLLRGLSFNAAALQTQDAPYLNYALRIDVAIEFLQSIGLWDNVIHPWYDVFLPNRSIDGYVADVVPSLTPDDVGATGFVILFPQKRSKFTRPFFRVPHSDDWIFLFDILTAAQAPGPNPAFAAKMLSRNRRLFDKARLLGGTRYPIGALPFNKLDWAIQYGDSLPELIARKLRYDPDRILTPGPGIF